MRAAVLHGTAGSLLLTGLVAAPAGGAPAWPGPAGSAETRGTAVAAQRSAAAGIRFAKCPKEEHLPSGLRCGTVTVPLDYALPDGKRIRLTVSRVQATGKDPHNAKHKVPRQGALVYNPGGPGASGMYFPLIGMLPAWKRIGAAYDLVGYAPRGVGGG
ncbi:alpha/beta hydrolase, partial [Streptomyces sp. SAS_267]